MLATSVDSRAHLGRPGGLTGVRPPKSSNQGKGLCRPFLDYEGSPTALHDANAKGPLAVFVFSTFPFSVIVQTT